MQKSYVIDSNSGPLRAPFESVARFARKRGITEEQAARMILNDRHFSQWKKEHERTS